MCFGTDIYFDIETWSKWKRNYRKVRHQEAEASLVCSFRSAFMFILKICSYQAMLSFSVYSAQHGERKIHLNGAGQNEPFLVAVQHCLAQNLDRHVVNKWSFILDLFVLYLKRSSSKPDGDISTLICTTSLLRGGAGMRADMTAEGEEQTWWS